MFGRKEKQVDQTGSSGLGATRAPRPGRRSAVTTPPEAEHTGETPRPGAKNRPTPSRKEAEAARRRPLVPSDRKAAEEKSKEVARAERIQRREAMYAGEDWALMPRDKGPVKAYLRDYIDARWSLGEFVLPVMIIGLFCTMTNNPSLLRIGMVLVYGVFIAALIDVLICWLLVKKRIAAKFGAGSDRGLFWQTMSRVIQIRPTRVPRPRVKRGQFPS